MTKGALVGLNVSDTDELRINKINSNFRLVLTKVASAQTASMASPQTLVDGNPDKYLTEDDLGYALRDLKKNITWLIMHEVYIESVKEISTEVIKKEAEDEVEAVEGEEEKKAGIITEAINREIAQACEDEIEGEEVGVITLAILREINQACEEGGVIYQLVRDAVDECNAYTDSSVSSAISSCNAYTDSAIAAALSSSSGS